MAGGPGVADSAQLFYLDEANLLDNLSVRFTADAIYTYTGTVLLVIWVALMMSISEHRFRSAIRSWGKYHRACCRYLLGIRRESNVTHPRGSGRAIGEVMRGACPCCRSALPACRPCADAGKQLVVL